MAKGDSLADQLFNQQSVARLAHGFADEFDADAFIQEVTAQLAPLALKERIAMIARVLEGYLSQDFTTAAAQIQRSLPPPLDPNRSDDDFGHFIYASLGVFVENQAIGQHCSLGLDLVEQLTQRFSMEFSIRGFLIHHTEATMERMRAWALHENYHVRRLASEGTRPRLPWGQHVPLTHADTLPILDQLHADQTRFVVRSVANHLNDISKTDPDAVLDRLDAWVKRGEQNEKELLWLRKHALRGLIKQGDPRAMTHLGFTPDLAIKTAQIALPAQIVLGQKVQIAADFTLGLDAPVIADYVIDFQKSGSRVSQKVFKIKQLSAKADVLNELRKTHHFDPTATTFKLYPGAHKISLQLNGRIVAAQEFTLT